MPLNTEPFNPEDNYRRTRKLIGYLERKSTPPELYAELGFRCGLEIHQQLKTPTKLFCNCPAGIYQGPDEYDAEVIRHMRPTLSEMGEYDGTALMERKTKKNIVYRIKSETACTYEFDDTPPFKINRNALDISIEIALMLKTNIVGELHVTRKQYLDGSIPTGFQRTAIVGIEGEIPLAQKKVRIIQISIEEDSCREVSDIGHWRVFTTDRLGMPLIETVTYPDMLTPDEAAEAAQYLRFLARSSGKVRTGIGAAREDVNVSITGGTRVEIKGVAHIKWIPELTHNEAFRQKALLEIAKELQKRISAPASWEISWRDLTYEMVSADHKPLKEAREKGHRLTAVNLARFRSILSFFTQPGQSFADELSGRLKVIACLERPNMIHSEQIPPILSESELSTIRELLEADEGDAQVIVWGADEDVKTALETIQERCRMAVEGVPNETRKSLPDGTTVFERVLPGPDRMYPDTDSAPIAIDDHAIEKKKSLIPPEVSDSYYHLRHWQVPEDTYTYLLKRNLVPLMKQVVDDFDLDPKFVGTLLGHVLKHAEGQVTSVGPLDHEHLYRLFEFVHGRRLHPEILKEMLPYVHARPESRLEDILDELGYSSGSLKDITESIPELKHKFVTFNHAGDRSAAVRWIMGNLRPHALGNVPLHEVRKRVEKEVAHD